ncbi:MAG: hypothetical protein ACWA5W_06580, partial [Phycisphaerales bacterium]
SLSHFAIWPTLYALGVYVLLSRSLPDHQLPQSFAAIAFIFLCTHASYLLDRVKISDDRLDEADAIALPDRAHTLSSRSNGLRRLILIELLVGSGIGFVLHPILALIPIAALVAIHSYAGRSAHPSRPRLKDLPGCKPFFIATSHVALALVVLWAPQLNRAFFDQAADRPLGIIMPTLSIWLIVVGDAMLCDIDDLDTDRAFGTKSFAVLFSKRRAWIIATSLITIGSAGLILDTPHTRWVGFTLILTTLLTKSNRNHRDFVDARLFPIALLSMV